MKVFVLSGSSSIGQAAIRVLLDAGHEVCATYRSGVPDGFDGATWVRTDVRSAADLDALAGPAQDADVLLLLPGMSRHATSIGARTEWCPARTASIASLMRSRRRGSRPSTPGANAAMAVRTPAAWAAR